LFASADIAGKQGLMFHFLFCWAIHIEMLQIVAQFFHINSCLVVDLLQYEITEYSHLYPVAHLSGDSNKSALFFGEKNSLG